MTFEEEWLAELGSEAGPPRKRAGYALPYILSRNQVRQILRSTGSLALRTIYASGLREREVVGLKPTDIGEDHVKVGDLRVPIDRETARDLQSGKLDDPRAALLSCSEFQPSALRHAFATHRLEAGMDVIALHHILGNENPSTTLQYVHTAIGLHAPAYFHCHPLAQSRGPFRALPDLGTIGDEKDGDEELPPHLGTPSFDEVKSICGDEVILRLYYSTGMRRNELLSVRHCELDREETRIFVRRGKEDKDRYVLLDTETANLIPEGPPNEPIFSLTPRQVDDLFHQAAIKTGILPQYEEREQTVSLHCLRRAFATHCYLNGMPLNTLKRLMGHGQLTTTALYLEVPFQHCAAQVPGW